GQDRRWVKERTPRAAFQTGNDFLIDAAMMSRSLPFQFSVDPLGNVFDGDSCHKTLITPQWFQSGTILRNRDYGVKYEEFLRYFDCLRGHEVRNCFLFLAIFIERPWSPLL